MVHGPAARREVAERVPRRAAAGRHAGRDGRDGKLEGMPAGGDVLRARFRRRRLVLVQRRRLGLGFNRFGASFADPPPDSPFRDAGRQNVHPPSNRPKRHCSSTESGHAPLSVRAMSLSRRRGKAKTRRPRVRRKARTGRRLRARSREPTATPLSRRTAETVPPPPKRPAGKTSATPPNPRTTAMRRKPTGKPTEKEKLSSIPSSSAR